jgi:molybdopterin molybdotransferase
MTASDWRGAQDAMLRTVAPQPMLRVPLPRAAGLHLAVPVVAGIPLPRWRSASMDGFAVHGGDLGGASPQTPVPFTLVGATAAGEPVPPRIPRGTAWRVATGGRVPPGIDTVVRQEDARVDGAIIQILDARDMGRNLREEGADVAVGDTVLRAGMRLHPGRIALLASLGEHQPMVHRRPRIGILTSGDELGGPGDGEAILAGERIADANQPMLAALVQQAGGEPVSLGRVADDAATMQARIASAADIDLILSAGGVSVGPHDHVPAVMTALGVTPVVTRVRLRPGGPTRIGVLGDGRVWLALPGNPVSAFVTFHLFAWPAIRRMLGDPDPKPTWRTATLGSDIPRDPTLDLFLRVTFPDGDVPVATPTGSQASWVISSIARAGGLVHIAPGTGAAAAGETVPLLPLGGP